MRWIWILLVVAVLSSGCADLAQRVAELHGAQGCVVGPQTGQPTCAKETMK
jgi:uncharacterized protein YceK